MASMVHIFPLQEQYNLEGYASSAALRSSHFAPPSTILPCHEHNFNGAADSVYVQPYSPFTQAPHSSSACPHKNDHFSYTDAITRSINADGLSFNPNTSFGMEFPLAEENQLHELMGLQKKLSIYNPSYGDDDHELCQASITAADDNKEIFSQAYTSLGDEAKLNNLARSSTFPLAGGRSESSCAAKPPLLLVSDADVRNPKNFDDKRLYRESSSAATTSCRNIGNGDDNELYKGKDVVVKIEAPKDSQCMLGDQEQQGCIEQQETTLTSRAYKQNKKRSTNMSNSNTSAKVARLETPPDVVHIRARRGQATDSHSLAERVRREKISQRMKLLQEIVPGCHKVLGKAMMLDEIINYVKSLQKQVEFLSMKLAAANQVGMPSIVTNEVKFLLPNMTSFGEVSSSCPAMKFEPLTNSLIH